MLGVWKSFDRFSGEHFFRFPDVRWPGKLFANTPSTRETRHVAFLENNNERQGRSRWDHSNIATHSGSRWVFESKSIKTRIDEIACKLSSGIRIKKAQL